MTDSTAIGITFQATNMVTPPRERRPITMSLECGDLIVSKSTTAGNVIILNPEDRTDFKLERGEPGSLVFDNLPKGSKDCELWLPHNAFVELRSLELDDESTIALPKTDTRKKWIHYGSSISHCMEANEPAKIWPAVAARVLPVR